MNAKQRKTLNEFIGQSEAIRATIETARDEEQEKFENLSDGARDGERGERMQAIISSLEDAIGSLESFESSIEEATGE